MVLVRCVDDRWCWQCRSCGRLDQRWYDSEIEAMDRAQDHEAAAHPPLLIADAPLAPTA
jgi:hypothetical protein